MALPTLDKTWRFKANQSYPTTGVILDDWRRIVRAIKTTLITASGWTDSAGAGATLTNPWTVVASSNGTTANLTDLWAADTDLTWNTTGNARSWIVLRQAQIHGGNYEVCIECRGTSSSAYAHLCITVSLETGFDVSSPVTTNRPTASDEYPILVTATWLKTTTSTFSCVLHAMVSDDGQCTRLVFMISNAVVSFWLFDRPNNPVTNWTYPAVTTFIPVTTGGGVPSYATLNDVLSTLIRGPNISGAGNKNGTAYLSTEFYNSKAVGESQTTANDISGEWPMTRTGISCTTTGVYGRPGELYDLWFGSTGVATADGYPASGTTKQFLQFGYIILPWNTTTPVTS